MQHCMSLKFVYETNLEEENGNKRLFDSSCAKNENADRWVKLLSGTHIR